jgi:hypothetical protein
VRDRSVEEAGGSLPARAYRDRATLFAVLAAAIVGVTLLTGGGIAKAVAVAIGFFVLATGWTWWKFHARLARERKQERS